MRAIADGDMRPVAAGRLLSLDVLRGVVVMGMILVTDPGTYEHVYPQLRHAVWDGPTATDLIFPCFLVMVGMSMPLSVAARLDRGVRRSAMVWRVARRSVLLVALGVVVNGFPHYVLATYRWPGILQRIGICYLCSSLLYLMLSGGRGDAPGGRMRRRMGLGVAAFLLLAGYWWLLARSPVPGFGTGHLDPLGNVAAVLDRAVFGQAHMFQWGVKTPGVGVTFDPEGILSTMGALATMLFGVVAGDVLCDRTDGVRECRRIASAGTALWLLSLLLSRSMPLNKQIYTPTFALWSAGLSLLAFAGALLVVDVLRVRRGWALPLVFGTNAILAFCLSQVVTSLLGMWRVGTQPLYTVLAAHLFGTWLPPRMASLGWAVGVVLLNAAMVYPLYRRRIFLRL